MNDERDEAALGTKLLRNFATIFTFSVLAMIIAGMLIAAYAPDAKVKSTIYTLGGAGLTFSTLLQITGFSFILAVFVILIFSDRYFKKLRFLQRTFIFLPASLFTLSIFAIIFKWFPIDEPLAWLGFVITTIFCASVSMGLTLLKLKLESKKYDRLLANYKARRTGMQGKN